MRLIIDGVEIPIKKESIYQSKQVNTLFRLDNRQTNYTNSFKLPKTPEVTKAFSLLGIVGNTSRDPYEKNNTQLLSDSGECFIYNGFSVIQSVDEYINVTVYDGNIDIYQAMGSDKLSDIPMPLLNHQKNVANVANSTINITAKYRYMLADFGAKTKTNGGLINIDYMCPFASVKYMWDCIFEHYGFTYEGSVFNTAEFTNLWLSYPKGTAGAEVNTTVFVASQPTIQSFGNFLSFGTPTTVTDASFLTPNTLVVNKSGRYRIELNTTVNTSIFGSYGKISIVKNTSEDAQNAIPYDVLHEGFIELFTDTNITIDKYFDLQEGDQIKIAFSVINQNPNFSFFTSSNIQLTRIENASIDFTDSFSEFTVRDFFNEILYKFGLTPIKDKYTNKYTFKLLSELLVSGNAVDWSDKFVSVTNESYVLDSYGQNNYFKYKYHDENDTHFNANLPVNNETLESEKTILQSKTFAPSKMENGALIWKMFDREIKDDGQVDFKNLTGRFFFATSNVKIMAPGTRIGSDKIPAVATYLRAYQPLFKYQDWNYIMNKYYSSFNRILQDSVYMKVRMNLNDFDILNLDFGKMVYIEQLSNYYLIQKIDKYKEGGGVTDVELVRVKPITKQTRNVPVFLTDGTTRTYCVADQVQVMVENYLPTDTVVVNGGFGTLTDLGGGVFNISGLTRPAISLNINGVESNLITLS